MCNIIILLSLFVSVNCHDYCQICANHVACNNNGSIAEPCTTKSNLINLSSLQDYILTMHNTKRNAIALGQVNKFAPACRMATMLWDNELANLAELNVKNCQFTNDACHDTSRFQYSGQNIEIWWGTYVINPFNAVRDSIENWYNEYHYVDMSLINSFRIMTTREIGHFAVMIADKNTKLGCALLMTSVGPQYIFTCNYARDNLLRQPIYKSGAPASQCKTGKNKNYPGLCSINEDINPNALS